MSPKKQRMEAKKKDRRLFNSCIGAIVLVLFALPCYYTWQVFNARAQTPGIIQNALHSDTIALMPEDLSPQQLKALLLYQDPNFFTHKGWDFFNGTITTITQSLVKKHYFKQFKPGIAKIRQSLIARFALDPQISKQDQLCLFINSVYLGTVDGQSVIGFAQGAELFYRKKFKDLTFDEYLSLLDFDSPNTLNPHANPDGNRRLVLQMKQRIAEKSKSPTVQ